MLAPTSGREREHTSPTYSLKKNFAASYHASAASVLQSSRIGASLGKCHFLPKWCKWCQNGLWCAQLSPTWHFFTQPDSEQRTYIPCMVGAGSGASMGAEKLIGHSWGGPMVETTASMRARKQIGHVLGGFNRGDDHVMGRGK